MPKPPSHIRVPRGSGNPPAVCDSCKASGTISEVTQPFPVVIQREEFICDVPRMVCSSCDAVFSTPAQFDRSMELGVATYQRQHKLLTAHEIKAKRKALGWTQDELSERASVGPASVKRWERGRQVQTAANDLVLRHAFSLGSEEAEEFYVIVTQSYTHRIGELRSFSSNQIANPQISRVKKETLRLKSLNWGISDQPLTEECYA